MAIATLTVDLVAKLGAIEQDLGRLGTVAQRQADQISGAFAGVRSTLAGLGVATTIGGMVAAFKTAADALDRLNDAADATGASIESLSKLENVARRNGAGIELVEGAVLRMNKALNASDEEGKGAAAVLKALGLNAEELKRQDPAIALQKVAVAFNQFERDGNLARAAQELFGKSIAEVAPFLKDLAEAGTLNATVTARQAEEAEKFNKSIFALQANIGNLARAITADLLPPVNRAIEQMAEGTRIAGGFLNALRVFGTSTLNMDNAGEKIREFTDELATLRAERDRYTKSGTANSLDEALTRAVTAPLDRQIADLQAKIEFARVLQRQAALKGAELLGDTAGERRFAAGGQSLALPPEAKKPSVSREDFSAYEYARQQAQLLGKELESLAKRQAEVYGPMSDMIAGLRRQGAELRRTADQSGLTEDQIADLTASQIEEAATLAELNGAYASQIDAMRAVAEGYRDIAEATREKRIAEALQGTAAGKLEAQRNEMALYADAVERGRISAEQFSEIAASKLGLVAEETRTATGEANIFGQIMSSAFEDAIVDGESLRKVVQSLGKDILRAGIRQGFTQPIGNAAGGFISAALGITPGSAGSSGGSGVGNQLLSSLGMQGINYALGSAGGLVGITQAFGAGLGLTAAEAAAAAGAYSAAGYGATAGAISAGAAAGGGTAAAGAAGSMLSTLAAAAPYIAAVVALVAAFADFKGGTPHAGAVVFGSQTGSQSPSTQAAIDAFYRDPRQNQQFRESDFTKRYNKGIADALSPVAENLAQVFNKITTEFGAGSGFKVGLGFSADGEDKSRGRFSILDSAGNEITDFLRRFSKDAATGMQQFGVAAQQGLLAGLREVDLGGTVNAVLDKSLQGSTDYLTRLSQDQTAALLGLLEGGMLDELFQNVDLASTSWDGINQRIVEFSRVAQLDPLFDRLGISITEFGVDIVGALGGLESAAGLLQQVIDFQSVQADAANLFAGSIRNIKFGVLDDPGKYEFLDKEANRFRDVLASLSDVTLIQDYAAKLNDTINTAFNILSPEQQALYAEDFITRLESASQLTQDRLLVANESRDKIFEQLPDKIEQAVRDGLKPVADAMVTAAREGRTIDIRLPAGLEVG